MAAYTPDYLQPGGTVSGAPAGATYQALNPDELASNQLEGLLGSGSRYIQNARDQGYQYAASRGLLNSDMAAGASENAAIGAAAPIAIANAQEVAQIGAANQQAANQYTGENIAANAQTDSASISAGAQRDIARLQVDMQTKLQEESMAQQYKEFGVSTQDQVDEFNTQQKNAMAQFETAQNNQIGEFQSSMDWNKYSLGVNMQMHGMDSYTQNLDAMLANPNMTADDRRAMMDNLKGIYSGYNQQMATIPAFVPGYASDPNYWAENYIGGTQGGLTSQPYNGGGSNPYPTYRPNGYVQ